jgi:ketosteroid isomerase-like protein
MENKSKQVERIATKIQESLQLWETIGGNVENKASFVDHLVSGQSDFVTMEVTDLTISIVDHVGIIRFSLFANINDKGKPSTVKLKVMYVWVKEKKEWKLLARQAVKILP